jgi:hypothetical protein
VFAHIEQEESPRPLLFQLDLLREAGSQEIEFSTKAAVLWLLAR